MKLNIDCCFFILENIKSENKKRNDIKKLKLLVDKNRNIISVPFNDKEDIKESIREKISKTIGSEIFHLEQVTTLGEKKFYDTGVHIVYVGITNMENIKKLDKNYELIDFNVIDKKDILFGNDIIQYETKVKKAKNNLEYYHNIKTKDINLERNLIEVITSYKHIIKRIDYSDIIYKFLPKYFSLEDVRIIYEMITNTKVDKSNFRKRIIKYCKLTDKIVNDKGYRPTHLYEFIPDEKDIWL